MAARTYEALTCPGPGVSRLNPPCWRAEFRLPRSIAIPSTTIEINTIAEFAAAPVTSSFRKVAFPLSRQSSAETAMTAASKQNGG